MFGHAHEVDVHISGLKAAITYHSQAQTTRKNPNPNETYCMGFVSNPNLIWRYTLHAWPLHKTHSNSEREVLALQLLRGPYHAYGCLPVLKKHIYTSFKYSRRCAWLVGCLELILLFKVGMNSMCYWIAVSIHLMILIRFLPGQLDNTIHSEKSRKHYIIAW